MSICDLGLAKVNFITSQIVVKQKVEFVINKEWLEEI